MIRKFKELRRSDLPDAPLLKKPKGKKTSVKYYDLITAFDIETTHDKQTLQAFMYVWQFQIGDDLTIIGRDWKEFLQLTWLLQEAYPDGTLVCFDHNLSYEFQWLKSILPLSDVFAMDSRKVLRFRSANLEFRCSYLHSNMSLDKFLETMGVKNKKVHGFDYGKTRYPWTRLSPDEMEYICNDVIGLVQAIKAELEKDGDDLYTQPLTSTGYARRIAKRSLGKYRRFIQECLPDLEVFGMLRNAFRGGNTHANRWNSNRIMLKAKGKDISSAYPVQICKKPMPWKFKKVSPDDFDYYYFKRKKACLMRVYLQNVKLRNESWGCPYIPRHKCFSVQNAEYDNGRILSADALVIYLTEIDFEIILQEYDFDYEIELLYVANKRLLPKEFRQEVIKLYKDKTMLKGVDEYLYGKRKNVLNSYYGMMVQNPCKGKIEFSDGLLQESPTSDEELIEEYHRSGWLPYQWGVWVTAYARQHLERGLQLIDPWDFIYSDTDSIKYLGDYEEEFAKLNEELKDPELSAVDPKGKVHYMGLFEDDGYYPRFKTMGAKKYCYEDEQGKLHVTISGVGKKEGADELGTLENFQEGFVFRKAGGTESRYNDDPPVKEIIRQGKVIPIISNIYIQDSTYTLSLTTEYRRLLNYLMTSDISKTIYMQDYYEEYSA